MSAAPRRSRISEGSCWTCRKRRIKCDAGKPRCVRCRDSEQPCSYGTTPPIKWVGGMAKRGRLASSPVQSPPTDDASDLVLLATPTTHPPDHDDLLLYFVNAVLPRFQIPDIPIILDFNDLLQDLSLQQAMLAVSQAHYALNSKSDPNNVALVRKRARHTAIEGFRKRLELGVHSCSAAQRLFTVNILLCILDGMIEPSEELNASIYHLKGGFAILEQWMNTPTRMLAQNGLQAHLLSLFATIDLVHALLSGEKPFFEAIMWKMFAGVQAWWGCLDQGDRFLEILKAFSDMASLGQLVHSNLPSLETTALVEKCLPPIENVLNVEQQTTSNLNNESTDCVSEWAIFCSIWGICGAIYMQRALRMKPMDDEMVQLATRRGVEKLIDTELPGMMRHCVIFPMLVIGAHCVMAQDRRAIIEALSPSSSYLSFGNLQLMSDFWRDTWNWSDSQVTWWDCFGTVSQKTFLF